MAVVSGYGLSGNGCPALGRQDCRIQQVLDLHWNISVPRGVHCMREETSFQSKANTSEKYQNYSEICISFLRVLQVCLRLFFFLNEEVSEINKPP